VIERWPAVHGRWRGDIDQGVIDVGQRQAKVADLTRLVSQRFGLVNGAEELGERQRGAKTDCDKPRAQGRCTHAVDPAPSCVRGEPTVFSIGSQPCIVGIAGTPTVSFYGLDGEPGELVGRDVLGRC
jgi:uncharacterized Fe-S cluster protein YjdI